MSKVYCDECNKYTATTIKRKKHPRDIEEMYFKCDHCYHHYTIAVTNKRARKLQRTMKRKGIEYLYNEYDTLDAETGTEVQMKKSKEQIELDRIMSTLKSNLILYGVPDL